jgi:hypothetical protein
MTSKKMRAFQLMIIALAFFSLNHHVLAQEVDDEKRQTFIGITTFNGDFLGGTVSVAGAKRDSGIRPKFDGMYAFDLNNDAIGGVGLDVSVFAVRGGVQYDFEGGERWKPFVHGMAGYYRAFVSVKGVGATPTISAGKVGFSAGGGVDYVQQSGRRWRFQGDADLSGYYVGNSFRFSAGRVF